MPQLQLLLGLCFICMALGCGSSDLRYPELPPEALDGAYSMNVGTVEIGSEKFVEHRGVITVPENRYKPASRFSHLPFRRIRSNSEKPREPVFILSGGPGMSNMEWSLENFGYLLPDHDLVAVGYRGVDGSVQLDCPKVTAALKDNDSLLGTEILKKLGQAWTESARRLAASGIDIDRYTMPEVIEDNEAVRKTLGYQRIDLMSGSYGTRVAYLYSTEHPAQIRRSIMIGANPPGHFVWDPKVVDAQLRYYSELWSRDSVASLRTKDLYGDMKSVLNDMPKKWLFFSIDPGRVKVVTFALLFQRETAAKVFDAYLAAKEGDPSGLALMSAAFDYTFPSMMTWGEFASKAVSADSVFMGEYITHTTPSPDLPLGSPMSDLVLGSMPYGAWPIGQIPERFRTPVESDVETLLLNGSIDFSTPAEIATREFLPYLRNGRQIILAEYGHVGDVEWLNRDNTIRIVTSYYNTGIPDTSLNKYIPMDFNAGTGFPAMAKAALITVVVLGVGLGALLVWTF